MIYVVIISYTRFELIQRLVLDYSQFISEDHTIIVVDNKGDTELEEFVVGHGNCQYFSKGNLGYGQGFNFALRSISFKPDDLILLSNDDVVVTQEAIHNLFIGYNESQKQGDESGLVMPMFIDSNGNKQTDRYESLPSVNGQLHTVKFGPAALWLMNYQLIKKVGGFVPSFFMYAEDKEYVFRMRYLGFRPIVVLNSVVTHNFEYPPKNKHIRLEKEINTIASHYLNRNTDRLNPHWVACKGMVYSIITFQGYRLLYGIRGYIGFFQRLPDLKKIRAKIEQQPPFLFIYE